MQSLRVSAVKSVPASATPASAPLVIGSVSVGVLGPPFLVSGGVRADFLAGQTAESRTDTPLYTFVRVVQHRNHAVNGGLVPDAGQNTQGHQATEWERIGYQRR